LPNKYATPPPMFPNFNPATYANGTSGSPGIAGGDYALPFSGNPYNEVSSSAAGNTIRPIIMNRPFRSVGEMGYAFRDQPFKTLDFSSAGSPDAGLLVLFAVSEFNDTSGMRGGVVNLNTQQVGALSALMANTIALEGIDGGSPTPSPIP